MPGIASKVTDLVLSAMPRIHKGELALLAFAGLFSGIGFIYAVIAFYLYLERTHPPDVAAIYSAAFFMALALLAVMGKTFLRFNRKSEDKAAQRQVQQNIHVIMEDLQSNLDQPVRENPKTAVALASLAGFLLASRLDTRRNPIHRRGVGDTTHH